MQNKMTRRQIIKCLLNKVDDNLTLQQVISKRKIKKRLNKIKKVTFLAEEDGASGSWNATTGTLNIDISLCSESALQNETIIHELLHIITTSSRKMFDEKYTKCGLLYCISEDGEYSEFGRSINEGITDLLAEEISGTQNSEYKKEKDMCKILMAIVGKKELLTRYFDNEYLQKMDENTLNNYPYSTFNFDLESKYGQEQSDYIREVLLKVVSLLDKQTAMDMMVREGHQMSSEETQSYSKYECEMYNMLNQLIQHILDNKNANISKQDEVVLKSWIDADRLSLRKKYRVDFQDNSTPNLINDTESSNIDKNGYNQSR